MLTWRAGNNRRLTGRAARGSLAGGRTAARADGWQRGGAAGGVDDFILLHRSRCLHTQYSRLFPRSGSAAIHLPASCSCYLPLHSSFFPSLPCCISAARTPHPLHTLASPHSSHSLCLLTHLSAQLCHALCKQLLLPFLSPICHTTCRMFPFLIVSSQWSSAALHEIWLL